MAPLVSKLPSAVQSRILKVAGQVLENGGWCKDHKNNRRSNSEPQNLLSHQPFLSLVLTCLKGQEEGQREGLLSSLYQQLSQVSNFFLSCTISVTHNVLIEFKKRQSLMNKTNKQTINSSKVGDLGIPDYS